MKNYFTISLPRLDFFKKNETRLFYIFIILVSLLSFWFFYQNGLGLAYNDARSHLNIGRRVVEGLKPGLAQIGSVWLPLPHLLMVPTVWNDFFWHTGLSGAIISMISFVVVAIVIYKFLDLLQVGRIGKYLGVGIFLFNLNILYLQATAMTELLLLATMTLAVYEFVLWQKTNAIKDLILSAFFVMLSTLIRYDGWFLLAMTFGLVFVLTFLRSKKWSETEGTIFLFGTLAGIGILAWLVWNLLIFGDPLYFAFGPYSAHAQQLQLEGAGELPTKHNLVFSVIVYLYALIYNSNFLLSLLGLLGAIKFYFDSRISTFMRIASLTLLAPLIFNIIALYLGHSVLFIQGLSGNTWFNVRYGVMLVPTIAIFIAYLHDRLPKFRVGILISVMFVFIFSFAQFDAVTIDDALVGSSQKNVTEVSGWLERIAGHEEGFVMISAASHDAIIFSSNLPMKRFIHEGTGAYWSAAKIAPDRWARYLVMRTHDKNDATFAAIDKSGQLFKYDKISSYPFADIYKLKSEYLPELNLEANLLNNK